MKYATEYYILPMNPLEVYIDGAAKGNPGPAGVGIIFTQEGQVLKNISNFIGETTNNVAEYTALIHALEEALILKYDRLKVITDSQLLYRQLKGEYKVKSPNIISLFNRARHLVGAFKEVSFMHVNRNDNKGADKLANIAIKEHIKKNKSN